MHLDDLEPRRIGRFWIFPDGTTLPVVSGGDGPNEPDPDEPDPDEPDPDEPDPDKAPATDADWKHRARQWERRAKANARKLADAEAKSKSAGDKAIDEAKSAGRAEAHSKLAGRLFTAELREQAAGKLAVPASLLRDPQVALTMLELDELPVDEDGEVDVEAITDAIEALIKREPDLAAKPAADGDDADKGGKGGDGKGKGAPKVPAGPRGSKPKPLADHSVDDFRNLLKRK